MDTLELSTDNVYLRENSPILVVLNDGLLNLPLDALQIKGRLTPISAQSNVSTRESSLNSSPHNSRRSSYYVPEELEYDNVMPSSGDGYNVVVEEDEEAPKDKKNLLTVDDNHPPGFNWSPLPIRKTHSEKSELDTTESEVSSIQSFFILSTDLIQTLPCTPVKL